VSGPLCDASPALRWSLSLMARLIARLAFLVTRSLKKLTCDDVTGGGGECAR
jgi:hypothetical protein